MAGGRGGCCNACVRRSGSYMDACPAPPSQVLEQGCGRCGACPWSPAAWVLQDLRPSEQADSRSTVRRWLGQAHSEMASSFLTLVWGGSCTEPIAKGWRGWPRGGSSGAVGWMGVPVAGGARVKVPWLRSLQVSPALE